jgi:hypothetical protein
VGGCLSPTAHAFERLHRCPIQKKVLSSADLIASDEIADDLQAALEQFATIAADLGGERERQDYTQGN